MDIKIYTPVHKGEWNRFVEDSRNGTFLFQRDFIEYHAQRFSDYSLMFYDKGILKALLPGNRTDKIYYSHQGLTYGGLIVSDNTYMTDVLRIFASLTDFLAAQGFVRLIYKAMPHIYHKRPAEEDLYALFVHKASLSTRSISSSIALNNPTDYTQLRTRSIKKAIGNGLQAAKTEALPDFWAILEQNLLIRHNTCPTHTLDEITRLKALFPSNIHLHAVYAPDKTMLAGALMFITHTVAHVQYIAASAEGKEQGAADLLVDSVIKQYADKAYFDYGISTEDNGLYLNAGLIHHKEGFGCRGTVYDIYSIDL